MNDNLPLFVDFCLPLALGGVHDSELTDDYCKRYFLVGLLLREVTIDRRCGNRPLILQQAVDKCLTSKIGRQNPGMEATFPKELKRHF